MRNEPQSNPNCLFRDNLGIPQTIDLTNTHLSEATEVLVEYYDNISMPYSPHVHSAHVRVLSIPVTKSG